MAGGWWYGAQKGGQGLCAPLHGPLLSPTALFPTNDYFYYMAPNFATKASSRASSSKVHALRRGGSWTGIRASLFVSLPHPCSSRSYDKAKGISHASASVGAPPHRSGSHTQCLYESHDYSVTGGQQVLSHYFPVKRILAGAWGGRGNERFE